MKIECLCKKEIKKYTQKGYIFYKCESCNKILRSEKKIKSKD